MTLPLGDPSRYFRKAIPLPPARLWSGPTADRPSGRLCSGPQGVGVKVERSAARSTFTRSLAGPDHVRSIAHSRIARRQATIITPARNLSPFPLRQQVRLLSDRGASWQPDLNGIGNRFPCATSRHCFSRCSPPMRKSNARISSFMIP
jgi:hypothetical protein